MKANVEKIDYEYEVTEEQVRRFREVPLLDRLRWLEELCILTKMVRMAPAVHDSVARQPNTHALHRKLP